MRNAILIRYWQFDGNRMIPVWYLQKKKKKQERWAKFPPSSGVKRAIEWTFSERCSSSGFRVKRQFVENVETGKMNWVSLRGPWAKLDGGEGRFHATPAALHGKKSDHQHGVV